MEAKSPLVPLGWILLGIGLWKLGGKPFLAAGTLAQGLLDGTRWLKQREDRQRLLAGESSQLGDTLQDSAARIMSVPLKVEKRGTAVTVDGLVAEIRKLIHRGSLDPEVRKKALAVLGRKCGTDGSRKWCTPEKDSEAEVGAFFWALKDPNSPIAIRYTRDHAGVDQYHAAGKILRLRNGDCDDMVVLLGAMLRSVGYPLRIVVMQAKSAESWSHVALEAGIPPTKPTRWIWLDLTLDGPPGTKPPPHLIAREKVFTV